MQEVENSYSDEDEEVGNYEDELKQTRSRLVDGINIQELLSTNVATFEVNTNVESALEEQQNNYFSSDDFLQCVNLDCLGIASDDDEEEEGAPGTAPFDRIAQKMISLVPDGKVKKRIKREGTGNVVPNDALVWIHYNSYLEYADEPFDSTFLRGRSTKIRLNQGKLIPGLEIGIKTMKKAEIAQFLIHPDYGFGKFGVPPRIPPEAEILIHVELIRYLDNATISEMDALSKEEQQNAGFPKIYKTAESLVLKGNDQFKKDNFPSAIYNYKKAVRLLEPVHMENQEQQDKQQKLLCRTYINLAVCYNKQGSHRQACSNCQDALRIQPTNSKALYNYAMASLNLGSYNQAKSLALKARKQQPHSKEINALLEKLNSKFLKYKEESETMARRAFKMPEAEKKPQVNDDDMEDSFMKTSRQYLKDFAEDESQTTLTLPSVGMTKKEENFLKAEAEKLGLSCRVVDCNGQMYIKKRTNISRSEIHRIKQEMIQGLIMGINIIWINLRIKNMYERREWKFRL